MVLWSTPDTSGVSLMNYTGSVSDGSTTLATINTMTNTFTTEDLSCSTEYMIAIRANNCAGTGNSSTLSLTTGEEDYNMHAVVHIFLLTM